MGAGRGQRPDYTHIGIFVVIGILALSALARVGGVFRTNWNVWEGEFFISFPSLMVLERINPTLFASVEAAGGTYQWPAGPSWFYGPFHNLAYLPLLVSVPSAALFFHILLIAFILGIVASLAVVAHASDGLSARNRWIFFGLITALTFNQFAVLENLRQRNSELLEFILLAVALWALTRDRVLKGASFMALAALTKLLPAVFFAALVVKRLSRAVIAYLAVTLVVFVVTQVLLGWEHYALFYPNVAQISGVPTVEAIRGDRPIHPPSDYRTSLYSFLLLPAYDISFAAGNPAPIVRRTGSSLLPSHLAYVLIVAVVGIATLMALSRTGRDWLFAFGVLSTLMLMASPHCNPHYYVFPLFGLFWFVRRHLERWQARETNAADTALAAGVGVLLLMYGSIVPFGLVDRLFGLPPQTYFNMIAVYGIQGLATLLLWSLLMLTKFRLDAPRMATTAAAAA